MSLPDTGNARAHGPARVRIARPCQTAYNHDIYNDDYNDSNNNNTSTTTTTTTTTNDNNPDAPSAPVGRKGVTCWRSPPDPR